MTGTLVPGTARHATTMMSGARIALSRSRCRSPSDNVRNAAQRRGGEHVAELPALVALDEHEAPGPQPAVIRRAHRGLQDRASR